jgi:hypothetical protein
VAILCGTEPEALDSSAAHVCFGLCGRTGFYFFFWQSCVCFSLGFLNFFQTVLQNLNFSKDNI